MSGAHHLPSELTDEIIGYLKADRCALKTCSTVCKAWLPKARHHIFSSLSLSPSKSARFLELVDSPLSTIAPYVQHLDVTRTYGGGGLSWFKDLLPRLVIFTAVHSMTLTLANFVSAEADLRLMFGSTFQMLKHLALHRCRFKAFAQIVGLMCACPNLESFTSTDLTWNIEDAFSDPTQLRPSRHPHLRTLQLYGEGVGAVLNWLRSGEIAPPITQLVITLIYLDDADYVGPFLRTLGPSLNHLEVGVRSDTPNITKRLGREVDLSNNTRLRALHFKFINFGEDEDLTWILKIISQVTSSRMNELVFHISVRRVEDLKVLDWGALSNILEKSLFSTSLQRVHFIIDGGLWPKKAESYIRRSLRYFDVRGTLFVDCPERG